MTHRAPDMVGPYAEAWEVKLPAIPADAKPRMREQWQCHVATWLVRLKQAPPSPGFFGPVPWRWFCLFVVDLTTPTPTLGAAKLHYPEAQYEFDIWALDPSKEPDIAAADQGIYDPAPWRYMEPYDVVEQFDGLDRAQAHAVSQQAVTAIVNGHASPTGAGNWGMAEDWRPWWRQAIQNGVRHARGEAHLPPGGGR